MIPRDDLGYSEDGSFLTGTALSRAVRHVLGGQGLSCAVAFWGTGAEKFINEACSARGGLRVVCDLSMGGTHPDALRSLGAPDDPALRHRDGLHAKVYLSDRGTVVGSANASNNGLGFGAQGPRLIEAATFHAAGSKASDVAAEWFESIYADAEQIDHASLERARRLFKPSSESRQSQPVRPGSLLDMIVADPAKFGGVGFVLASTSANEKERLDARRSAKKAGIDRGVIESTTDHEMFVGWETDDVLRWPVSFIEFWMPRSKLHLYARTVKALDPVAGNVFARKDKRALRRLLPDDIPSFREVEQCDANIIASMLSDEGRVFQTAFDFAAAIETTLLL